MAGSIPPPSKPLSISTSRNFSAGLSTDKISLAVTTNQTNRLFLMGVAPDGQLNYRRR